MLMGFVPLKITRIPDLANVSLQNNKLQGLVPVFESGVKVELGEFGSNSFCLDKPGDCDYQVSTLLEIAGELGYPLSLAESWKGNDACAGWEFVSCDANKNNFSGTISPAFGNLTSLRSISLDGNNLVGPIPKVLTSLKDLQLLDVSRNNLSWIVPAFSPKHKYQKFGRVGSRKSVKRMEISVKGTKGMNEFQAEIRVLTKVRHRHLIALLGYCANVNERLLVYEYMPKGTLSQHLFYWCENNSHLLSWKQRVSIALDVGRGVGDFGLVKNVPDGKAGKFSIETKVTRTFGYLAP
nr:receptor-like kinase TMK4 [Tanacetum cinerariifolium]